MKIRWYALREEDVPINIPNANPGMKGDICSVYYPQSDEVYFSEVKYEGNGKYTWRPIKKEEFLVKFQQNEEGEYMVVEKYHVPDGFNPRRVLYDRDALLGGEEGFDSVVKVPLSKKQTKKLKVEEKKVHIHDSPTWLVGPRIPDGYEMEEGIQRLVETQTHRSQILLDRQSRYSTFGKATQNFIDVAEIAQRLGIDVSAHDVAQLLGILKLVRNNNGRRAQESAMDRVDHVLDVGNYLDLAWLCDLEEEDYGEDNESEYTWRS